MKNDETPKDGFIVFLTDSGTLV